MYTPFRLVLLFTGLTGLSWTVLPYLSVNLLPTDQSPRLEITFSVADSSPEVVEQKATALLEGIFSQLPQVIHIESVSSYNQGRITLQFGPHTDIALRQFEVYTLLRQIYPKLPEGVSYPNVQRAGSQEKSAIQPPLLAYTIEGPEAAAHVRSIAEEAFRSTLSTLPGVQEIDISGGPTPTWIVRFHPARLQALGILPEQLQEALHTQVYGYYPGRTNVQGESIFFLKYTPDQPNQHNLEHTSIPLPNGGQVKLKELATIGLEEGEAIPSIRINGKNAVTLTIHAQQGINHLILAQRIQQRIPEIATALPPQYKARLIYDHTEFLRQELRKIRNRTALSMGILLLFLLLAYPDWRNILTLTAGLAVNLGLTLLAMWVFQVEVQLYTLAALTLAFGIMIDNALLMLDYCQQQTTSNIRPALLGATLTTLAAQGLVYLLPQETRQYLDDFALVISIALSTSLIVADHFIPSLHQLLQKKNQSPRHRRPGRWKVHLFQQYCALIAYGSRYKNLVFAIWILAFGLPIFLLPPKIPGWRLYNSSVGSPFYQEHLRQPIAIVTGGALRLFIQNVYTRSGYRAPQHTKLYVQATLPHGSTLQHIEHIMQRMEALLEEAPYVEKYVTTAYSGELAQIEIHFRSEYVHSTLPLLLRAQLIEYTANWSGAHWDIYGVGQGFSRGLRSEMPSYQLKLLGYDYDTLEHLALRVQQRLAKHPRVQDIDTEALLVSDEKPNFGYYLQLDASRLSRQGISPGETFAALTRQSRDAFPPLWSTDAQHKTPLHLMASTSDVFSTFNLLRAPLEADPLRRIQLAHSAQLIWEKRAPSIQREDRQYVRVIGFNYSGAPLIGAQLVRTIIQEMSQQVPTGYTIDRVQDGDSYQVQHRNQVRLLGILVLANFIICAMLFESLRQSLVVIAIIPFALIGLFLTFAWGGFYFDQGGYAAMILLGGITINAAIFVIHDFNHRSNKRSASNHALLKALLRRSSTILLTVSSTICGLVPFLVDGDTEIFWFALAVGTIGGLVFSLVAVYTALPIMLWKSK